MKPIENKFFVKAATGSKLSIKNWLTEAPLRMLMNNLNPAVAEKPEESVVYDDIGKAIRTGMHFIKSVLHLNNLKKMKRYSYSPVNLLVFLKHIQMPRGCRKANRTCTLERSSKAV